MVANDDSDRNVDPNLPIEGSSGNNPQSNELSGDEVPDNSNDNRERFNSPNPQRRAGTIPVSAIDSERVRPRNQPRMTFDEDDQSRSSYNHEISDVAHAIIEIPDIVPVYEPHVTDHHARRSVTAISESESHRLRPIQRNHIPLPIRGLQLEYDYDIDGTTPSIWNQKVVQGIMMRKSNNTGTLYPQFNSLRAAIVSIFDSYSDSDQIKRYNNTIINTSINPRDYMYNENNNDPE